MSGWLSWDMAGARPAWMFLTPCIMVRLKECVHLNTVPEVYTYT